MKKSIDITQWKREPDIHHHCEPYDLRWRFKKAKWILVFHPEILWKCQDTVEDSFPLTGLALAIPQTRRLILSTRWARSSLRLGRWVFQLNDNGQYHFRVISWLSVIYELEAEIERTSSRPREWSREKFWNSEMDCVFSSIKNKAGDGCRQKAVSSDNSSLGVVFLIDE